MQYNSHTACNLLSQCLTVLVTNNLLTNYCKCNKHKKFTFCNFTTKHQWKPPSWNSLQTSCNKNKRFRIHIIFRMAYSPTVINLLSNSESCEHQILNIPKICIPRSYIIVPICQQVISLVYSLTICQIFVGGHPGN